MFVTVIGIEMLTRGELEMSSFGPNLKRSFKMIGNFKGRDSRKQFWPYVGVLYLIQTAVGMFIMIPIMFSIFREARMFAAKHPDQVNETIGPGSYSMHIENGSAVFIPDIQSIIWFSMISAILFVILIASAVVRRLHDRNKSGYWGLMPIPFLLTGFILMPRIFSNPLALQTDESMPLLLFANNAIYIGLLIWLIVMLAKEGTHGPNQYGEDPIERKDFWEHEK